MLLVIDIGNSNIVYGLFDGTTLRHQFRVETGRSRTADEYRVVLHQLLSIHGVQPGICSELGIRRAISSRARLSCVEAQSLRQKQGAVVRERRSLSRSLEPP